MSETAKSRAAELSHLRSRDFANGDPILGVGFIATAVSREIRMRDLELEDARWFTPQQIVDGIADGSFLPSTRLSVSYRLLAHWLHGRAGLDLDALTAVAPVA